MRKTYPKIPIGELVVYLFERVESMGSVIEVVEVGIVIAHHEGTPLVGGQVNHTVLFPSGVQIFPYGTLEMIDREQHVKINEETRWNLELWG